MGSVFPKKKTSQKKPRPKRGSPGRGGGGAAGPGVGLRVPPVPHRRYVPGARGAALRGLGSLRTPQAGLDVPRLPAWDCGRSLGARLAIGQSRSEGTRLRDWDPPLEAVTVVVAP